MRIMVGGLMQESNTFSAAASALGDFERHCYVVGEVPSAMLGIENEWTGFRSAAAEAGVELVPTLYATAVSSGRIGRASLDELKARLLAEMDRALPCDGILFALHGAWVAEDEDDADGEVLAAIRERAGPDMPIVVTLDSHANVTRRMIACADALVGYRTFPHVDYADTGYRAAKLLFAAVRGEIEPRLSLAKIPMIVPAENQMTDRGPMAELWAEAAAGEARGVSLATSLFAVQPWLDVREMGFAAVTVSDAAGTAAAEAEAKRLGELAWRLRKRFDVELFTLSQALALVEGPGARRPVIVSDSADSPGAGSPGDSNAVLRELLALDAGDGLKMKCLLSIVDAPAARIACEAGAGAQVRLSVGYSVSTTLGQPLEIEGVVARAGDGRFRFSGGHVAHLEANMGRCAVVALGSVSLLVMENPVFTGDPAMYRCMGLEPMEADLVLVKSAAQFRAEYEKLSDAICILDTPGASTANLTSMPYSRLERPMYPFDDGFRSEEERA